MHACKHTHTRACWLVTRAAIRQGSGEGSGSRAPTLRVLVGVGDVLPLITAHAFCADLHPHGLGVVGGLAHGPILLHDPVHHVGIDLSKDKRCIVLGAQVSLLDGANRNRATAVRPWSGVRGETGPGLRGGWRLLIPSTFQPRGCKDPQARPAL